MSLRLAGHPSPPTSHGFPKTACPRSIGGRSEGGPSKDTTHGWEQRSPLLGRSALLPWSSDWLECAGLRRPWFLVAGPWVRRCAASGRSLSRDGSDVGRPPHGRNLLLRSLDEWGPNAFRALLQVPDFRTRSHKHLMQHVEARGRRVATKSGAGGKGGPGPKEAVLTGRGRVGWDDRWMGAPGGHWHRLPKGPRGRERVGTARAAAASTVSVRVQPRLRPRRPLRRGQVPAPIDNSVAAECRGGPRRFAEHMGRTDGWVGRGRHGGQRMRHPDEWRAASAASASGADGAATSARTLAAIAAADARGGEGALGETFTGRRRLRTRAARRLHHCARRVQKERGNETKSEGKGAAAQGEGARTKGRAAKEGKTIKTKPPAESSASERLATNGARHLGRRQPPGACAAATLQGRHIGSAARAPSPPGHWSETDSRTLSHPELTTASYCLVAQRFWLGRKKQLIITPQFC